MENTITHEGFAFENGDVKLFPFCARNSDGSISKFETMLLIQEAARTFGAKSVNIPSDKIAGVLTQIIGAGQSHGITVMPQ